MDNHLHHLIISAIPFLAILIWLLKQQSFSSLSRIGMIVVVCLIVSLQTLPIHYFHASHFALSEKHDCCLPIPTVISTFFDLEIPFSKDNTAYQLLILDESSQIYYSFNNRAPPVS